MTQPDSVNYRRLSVLFVLTTVLTLAWVAAIPSTAVPIGTVETTGVSMGPDHTNDKILYIGFTEPEIGDRVIYYSDV
jgi:hypothetical protein